MTRDKIMNKSSQYMNMINSDHHKFSHVSQQSVISTTEADSEEEAKVYFAPSLRQPLYGLLHIAIRGDHSQSTSLKCQHHFLSWGSHTIPELLTTRLTFGIYLSIVSK